MLYCPECQEQVVYVRQPGAKFGNKVCPNFAGTKTTPEHSVSLFEESGTVAIFFNSRRCGRLRFCNKGLFCYDCDTFHTASGRMYKDMTRAFLLRDRFLSHMERQFYGETLPDTRCLDTRCLDTRYLEDIKCLEDIKRSESFALAVYISSFSVALEALYIKDKEADAIIASSRNLPTCILEIIAQYACMRRTLPLR